jgi:hypothetical protein
LDGLPFSKIEPEGIPSKLGVKLWIEHKKNSWSMNSAKSLKALAL